MTSEAQLVEAMESKRLGALTDRKRDAAMNAVRRVWPDSVSTRAFRGALAKLVEAHVAFVKETAAAGPLDAAGREKARRAILERFGAGMELGHMLAGVPHIRPGALEIASVASLVETELEHLVAFARGDEAMSSSQRSALYGLGVQAAMYRGWLASLPTNAELRWNLGIAEHCGAGNAEAPGGCLGLETGNPYSKPGYGGNPLPTLPGNGDTRCLGNCRCFVTASFPGGMVNSLAPRVAIEVWLNKGAAVDPTTPAGIAWSQQYQDLAERVAFFTRLERLDKPEAAYWARMLADTKADIDRVATRLHQKLRYTVNDAELLEPVALAEAHGMKFLPARELSRNVVSVGDIVWLLGVDAATQGKVMEVFTPSESNGPAVKLEGRDTLYKLDATGRYLLFRT